MLDFSFLPSTSQGCQPHGIALWRGVLQCVVMYLWHPATRHHTECNCNNQFRFSMCVLMPQAAKCMTCYFSCPDFLHCCPLLLCHAVPPSCTTPLGTMPPFPCTMPLSILPPISYW